MIIVLKQDAPKEKIHEFCTELEGMGLQINDSKGSDTHILGLIGDTKAIAERAGCWQIRWSRPAAASRSRTRKPTANSIRTTASLMWRA